MDARVLTYATHAGGTFGAMVRDAETHAIRLEVVGWGEAWRGYFGKLRRIRAELQSIDPDVPVIVLDAFDTRIVGGLEPVLAAWASYAEQADVVFSVSPDVAFAPKPVSDYIHQRIFQGTVLNAGMYMGRAGALARLIDRALPLEASCRGDDQRAFNLVYRDSRVVFDHDRRIFYNVEHRDRQSPLPYAASFVSYPGTFTMDRLVRMPKEYWSWLLPEIGAAVFVVVLLALAFRRR